MKFSYNWLKEYFKENLPDPEKTAEILTLRSFEVEGIKKTENDHIFDIDVLPNRMPDCSGHFGVAREISAAMDLKTQNPYDAKTTIPKLKSKILEIKIADESSCPRYMAVVMQNVKIRQSPDWLKEKLESLGINSINNAVDAANYIMLENGQPLHVFNLDKIENNAKGVKEIAVRNAKKGENITALDNKTYNLGESTLVISDSGGPLAIAGIKGGKKAEVDFETKNMAIEAANFDFTNIRKTSQKLNLRTDASIRFSYGIDPNLAEQEIKKLAVLIKKLAEGKIIGMIDVYPKKVSPIKIKLDFGKTRKLMGTEISDKDILRIIKNLGFEIQNQKQRPAGKKAGRQIIVSIPTRRRDIKMEEDIIEEIARMYGYENIKQTNPLIELSHPERNEFVFWSRKIQYALKEMGFDEMINYSFIGEKEILLMPINERNKIIEIENPIRPEFKFMRPALIFKLLENAAENSKNYASSKLFEIGSVFSLYGDGQSDDPEKFEEKRLAFAISNSKQEKNSFYRLKGVIISLFESLRIKDAYFDDAPESPAEFKNALRYLTNPFKSAQIKAGGEIIGIMGEIHNETKNKLALKTETVFAEMNFNALMKIAEEEQELKPISKYPAVIRDISILVPLKTKIEEVASAIENSGGELLADTDLFDVYEAEDLLEGKKSLAFSMTFQSYDETLNDQKINNIMKRIIETLEKNNEWEVRK